MPAPRPVATAARKLTHRKTRAAQTLLDTSPSFGGQGFEDERSEYSPSPLSASTMSRVNTNASDEQPTQARLQVRVCCAAPLVRRTR